MHRSQEKKKKATAVLPTPYSLSLPCPEVAHGRHKQNPQMLNPTRGNSHQLKPIPQEEDGGRWSSLSSSGQENPWLPARASKYLFLQCGLAALFSPVRSAGLEALQVGEGPHCRWRSIAEGQVVQESSRTNPGVLHSTPESLASLPASGWSLGPTAWLSKNQFP